MTSADFLRFLLATDCLRLAGFRVAPRIERSRYACAAVEESVCVCVCMCVCVWSRKRGEGHCCPCALLAPKEGSRGSEELERRRKKCHSNTASVKGI